MGREAKKQGKLFVITAPSGAGKTSLIEAVMRDDPTLKISVSYTTRAPRKGEKDAVDYHFVDEKTFRAMRSGGEFLESAEVHGNHYGTSRRTIEEALASGRDVLLEIDVQGAAQVKRQMPHAVLIFVEPPSLAILEQRLRNRRTEQAEALSRRLADAYDELRQKKSFDGVVVNTEVDQAVEEVLQIMKKTKERS